MKLIPAAATNGKVLIPLATMLAAGAVAIGSGASFTSQSTHTATVTSGILHHTNDHNGVTLAIGNMQPGDVQTGSLTITNDGSLDATAALTASNVTDGITPNALMLRIDETVGSTTTNVYDGDFLAASALSNRALGALPIGASIKLTYTVSLLNNVATNDDQNKSAGARFTYVTTQLNTYKQTTNTFAAITPSPAPASVAPPTVAP